MLGISIGIKFTPVSPRYVENEFLRVESFSQGYFSYIENIFYIGS